jgi:thiol-disulfide isomerase/thioredoxin
MDVRHVGDHECISCGKCIDTCAQGAISLKCGKITLRGPEVGKNADPEPEIRKRRKAGRIAWGIAIAVLVFSVAWFNFIEPAIDRANAPAAAVVTEQPAETAAGTETEAPAETAAPEAGFAESGAGGEAEGKAAPAADAPVGTEIGNLLPDFSTDLLSGETFTLSDYRGRVVIINFWGTTCAPCVEELPYYEQLKVAHPDVEILAIHNRAGAKKAKDFLADKGWDHLDFALDSKEKGLLPLLNAADAMPQTIILDKQGVVTYNAQAPLTLEKLEALYNQANQ